MSDFLPVGEDPRHKDQAFHAGYLKGLCAAAYLLDKLSEPFAGDPLGRHDDVVRFEAAKGWAECLRILGEAAEKSENGSADDV